MSENVMIVIIVIIVCIAVSLCILMLLIYLRSRDLRKEKLLELKNTYEKELKEFEWKMKLEWEDKINTHLKENKEAVDKLEKLKKEIIDEVCKNAKDAKIDLDKVAMIHLILSGCKEDITAENFDAEIKKVEKTYHLLKDKIA